MVELVDGNKGVVVITKCGQDKEEKCVNAFQKIVRCVMEVITDISSSSKLQFFLLDSTEESGILNSSNHFAISEVEEFLAAPQGGTVPLSLTGKIFMEPTKLTFLSKLAHWHNFFPIDRTTVLKYLENVVADLEYFGLDLGLCPGAVDAIMEENTKCDRRKWEIVKRWMSSNKTPPCWWHLLKALRGREGKLARDIERKHGKPEVKIRNCKSIDSILIWE